MPTGNKPSIKAPKSTVLLRLIDEFQEQFEPEYVNDLLDDLVLYSMINPIYHRDFGETSKAYDHLTLIFKLRRVMAELLKIPIKDIDKLMQVLEKS